jgi:hypothetical protein
VKPSFTSCSAAARVPIGSGSRWRASGITSSFTKVLSSWPASFASSRPSRATRTASSAVAQPAVLGSIQIRLQSIASIRPSWPVAADCTRRTATVTISQPLASRLACIDARLGYLPVPVINRLRNRRPPIINPSSGRSPAFGATAGGLGNGGIWLTAGCGLGRFAPSLRPGVVAFPMPLPLAAAPLLIAASPVPSDLFVPYVPPGGAMTVGEVNTFDPIGRARLIADQIPRRWIGSYRPFQGGGGQPVELTLESATAIGQMVDLRGQVTIAGVTSPVQGNLNAKSDQLDLLVLGDNPGPGLEPGGEFLGLQGLSLGGWIAPRLTDLGGRLQLSPVLSTSPKAEGTSAVRGLW